MKHNIYDNFSKIGITIPNIYIPSNYVDMKKWAVIACDQYSSQPDYWENLKKFIDSEPSTLNMILPEVYLEDSNYEDKLNKINSTMSNYLNDKIINNIGEAFILVKRKVNDTQTRNGLILAVDLEFYDYNKGSDTLIRATEGTIVDRLPPRIKIRENAPLEIPHVQMLIDDPCKSIIEPIAENTIHLKKLYDFELYKNKNIQGFKISSEKHFEKLYYGFKKLIENKNNPLLFAVGDGNHSLATAKSIWETTKVNLSENESINHPARYALVEIINLHDESLIFEPIHRILNNVNPEILINNFIDFYKNKNISIEKIEFDNLNSMENYILNDKTSNRHLLPYKFLNNFGILKILNPIHNLEVATLQYFIDFYTNESSTFKIDYIHGKTTLSELSEKDGSLGFYLPAMDKNELFRTVILDGSLPRKTFSMGESQEKRYYLECRKIKK
ncbi:MAG: DUF1015 domain-containing protein [Clostridiales bacterium]